MMIGTPDEMSSRCPILRELGGPSRTGTWSWPLLRSGPSCWPACRRRQYFSIEQHRAAPSRRSLTKMDKLYDKAEEGWSVIGELDQQIVTMLYLSQSCTSHGHNGLQKHTATRGGGLCSPG